MACKSVGPSEQAVRSPFCLSESRFSSSPKVVIFSNFKNAVLKSSVFGGLNGTLLLGNLSEKVGGEAPHLFSIGFPVGWGRLDPIADDFSTDSNKTKKSRTFGGVRHGF
jgi:hypothetical protein